MTDSEQSRVARMAGRVDTTRPAHAGRLGYLPGLDGLRALAILTVVAFHVGAFAGRSTLDGGFLGVQVFFVISGFLITALLVEEHDRNGRISLRAFYARRALRLFPALFAAVAVAVAYTTFAPGHQLHRTADEAVASIFYWDNWYHGLHVGNPTILLHTWSLSIEEQFYLVWPLLLVLALGLAALRTRLWLLPLAGAVAAALGRAVADLASSPPPLGRLYFGTDTRADALLIGCTLALVWARGLPRQAAQVSTWLSVPALGALAVLMWFETVPGRSLYVIGLLGCSLASAVLIANVLTGRPRLLVRLLEHPGLVFLGKVSYGLYLWHYVVFWIVRDSTGGWSLSSRVALELAIALAVAVASYYLLELPIVRQKARFTPQRA
jgi:peptidoglycan/LPS O-acetylase OafA/YrhL